MKEKDCNKMDLRTLSSKITTIEDFLNVEKFNIEKKKENGEYIEYLDLVLSFDIETSSFLYNGQKHACMYIWQMCLEGKVIIGRTWEEFTNAIDKIVERFELSETRRLICWVHNLSFEFQWIAKKFTWMNIFAREKRSPMKATANNGIEFRCSYILSGKSLEKVGEDLTTYKVNKLVGNLDYTKARGPQTKLTDEEVAYCVNDVLVVCAYIWEQMDYYKGITKIPLTNTGRVRKLCKKNVFAKDNYVKYRKLMNRLTLDVKEYQMAKRCFQGGFTHANFLHSENTLKNVKSFDFTSSYPTTMIAEKYPCTKGEKVSITIDEIERDKNLYCFIFNVRFTNIRPRLHNENYISKSKCWELKNPRENNGRVMSADLLTTTITEIDYFIIKDFYEWDTIEVGQCWRYRKAYLPTPFVETIVSLYEDKTTLKDVEGQEMDYQLKKGMLNSCYGMCCMDLAMDEVFFNENGWSSSTPDLKDCVSTYNEDKGRFLFYPWAIFITAYARRNLFYAIKELGEDYIYSDTDSVKFINYDKHKEFFERYNTWIVQRLDNACKYHHIDPERLRPKTIKGETKQLGIWDDECAKLKGGVYGRLKTLGAKRYILEADGHLKATIAGVNKKNVGVYLSKQDDAFEFFKDGMFVPEDFSGKVSAMYFDEPIKGVLKDYQGNLFEYYEESGIYMEQTSYSLGLSETYRTLLGARVSMSYAY